MNRVSYNPLNGRLTAGRGVLVSYEGAEPRQDSNYWSCSENNANNAWNVNFSNGNVNNNNNKNNSYVCRAVTATSDYDAVPADFIASVWEAYDDCLRGKRRSAQATEYMARAGMDIPELARELWTMTYRPGTSTCFLVSYPKWREVFAASFRDRIVHHWICLRLNPLFEERFRSQGDVSFNCRKGLGTERAVEYMADGMRMISDNYHKDAWVFCGDLEGFFMSIDKGLLWYLLERFTKRRYKGDDKEILLHAVRAVVMHRPEKDCVLNSPARWWEENVPRNKSLFTSPTGEPIGNLTTQLFANFLMSFFVSYVQRLYTGRNYRLVQFVDDFAIVCDDKRFLLESIGKIDRFLREKMKLTMHKDKRYLQKVSHGVLFVGTYIKPGRMYLSERTVKRMQMRAEEIRKVLSDEEVSPTAIQSAECTINSYLGFCRRRQTYGIRRKVIDAMGEVFWKYFYIKGHYDSIRTRNRYKLTLN